METYLIIKLGLNSYLIKVNNLLATKKIPPEKITKTPNVNKSYIGVFENENEIIPILDIRPFLSINIDKEKEEYKKTEMYINILNFNDKKYGILIDGFGDFININPINFNNNIFKTMVIEDEIFIALNMEKIINENYETKKT
jgi:chemotaxis signal transduction protein